MGCKYMGVVWVMMTKYIYCVLSINIYGYFGHVGNRIVVYAIFIVIHSPTLLVFACR